MNPKVILMATSVYIYKKAEKESEKSATLSALREFNTSTLFSAEDKVLINPNWVHCEHFSSGNTTSTHTIEGIVQYLIEECNLKAKHIVVGDGGFGSVDPTIKELNVMELKEKYGIKVLNLDKEAHIEKTVKKPLALVSAEIASIVDKVDKIISVPSLKTHIWAVTTLSMKNLMGLMSNKGRMHSDLHKKIADLCSLFRDKMVMSVIDGFIGSDMSETGGKPVKMNLLLIGEDPVALDTVGSYAIGYGVKKCKYLSYASQRGLGLSELKEIEIVGQSLEGLIKRFQR